MFLVFNLADILLTLGAGFDLEANPVVAGLGVKNWILAKVVLVGYFALTSRLFACIGWDTGRKWYRAVMTGLVSTVVLWNIRYLILC